MLAARLPTSRWIRGRRALALVAALSCLSASCSDKAQIVRVVEEDVNLPPTIVALGPTWPSTPIDLNVQAAPAPYVIVGDPNGLGDIALAVFTVDAAILRRIVVRPDSVLQDPNCAAVTWSDSIDITSLLPPTLNAGVDNCAMFRNGSLFTFTGFGGTYYYYDPCRAFPLFTTASPHFGVPTRSCGPQTLSRFGVYPPAVPAPVDVNVTFVDVEYQGLHVTVYDGAGHTATATFPPLRLVYRAYGEKPSPP
jgi:hypothetical protein